MGQGAEQMTKKRVLCVDDEEDLREIITFYLNNVGYEVDTASNGQEALDLALKNDYEFVLTDLDMPVMNGVDFIRQIRPLKPQLPIGIASAKITVFAQELVSLAVSATVPKPFSDEHIQKAAQDLSRTADILSGGASGSEVNKVSHIMKKELLLAHPDEKIQTAVEAMAKNHVGSILIVEEDKLVGLFTEKILLRLIAAGNLTVLEKPLADVMIKEFKTIGPDVSITYAEKLIVGDQQRYLPVIDEDRTLLGLVSAGDVSVSRLSHLKVEVENKIRQLTNISKK